MSGPVRALRISRRSGRSTYGSSTSLLLVAPAAAAAAAAAAETACACILSIDGSCVVVVFVVDVVVYGRVVRCGSEEDEKVTVLQQGRQNRTAVFLFLKPGQHLQHSKIKLHSYQVSDFNFSFHKSGAHQAQNSDFQFSGHSSPIAFWAIHPKEKDRIFKRAV